MHNLPPSGRFRAALAAIGLGIVVAGSVIGSGEMINTPVQAAKFGFVLLWVVLLSCVIKYFLQVEIARHCMVHNRTTFEAFNLVPGPKMAGASWVLWLYAAGYVLGMLTVVGIIGALGGVMHGLWPMAADIETSTRVWGAVMVVLAAVLLWQGWYGQLEKLVMLLVGGFSIAVAIGVFLVQGTPYRISTSDVLSGLTFSIGENRTAAAYAVISLMGALGVAANELVMYPYWILEKGYGRQIGDPGETGWKDRAQTWIRMIWLDAGFSTALAALVTAAFFLLGAAVLHKNQETPTGLQVVDQISSVFTAPYGEWSKVLFIGGALCTLFSTLVVIAAATGRMGADLFGVLGIIRRDDAPAVRRCYQIVQTVWLAGLLGGFLLLNATPEQLVVAGHFVLGVFVQPLIMCCICWLAFRTDSRVRMGRWSAVALLTSVSVILACVVLNAVVHLAE